MLQLLFWATTWRKILGFDGPDIKSSWRHRLSKHRYVIAGIVSLLLLCLMMAFVTFYYNDALRPVSVRSANPVRFTIRQGDSVATIAAQLEKTKLIKSARVFQWYLRLERKNVHLVAGTYALASSSSAQDIAWLLASGKTKPLLITILPGKTLGELRKTFLTYGYTEKEIDSAFNGVYTGPLFEGRPAGSTLEGYIFPETFEVQADDSLHNLLQRDFDTFYEYIVEENIQMELAKKGMTLYQGLTLASIIEQEASEAADQPQIAQVFLLRLQQGVKLESDVTFHYGAEKLGVAPNVALDSPYNTRLHPGLPPGPISNMKLSAIRAVTAPATGDFVYFIAGDEGGIYYARTLEEHERNIEQHCQKLCGGAF